MSEILFDFGDNAPAKPKSKPKFYTTGGRGKKQCQNSDCGVYVGVRNKVCPVCETPFVKKSPLKANAEPTVELVETQAKPEIVVRTTREFNSIVIAPAGKCPIKFDPENLTTELIIEWAEAVREWGLESKKYLTGQAIAYYARYSVDTLSDDYTFIRNTIREWDSDGVR